MEILGIGNIKAIPQEGNNKDENHKGPSLKERPIYNLGSDTYAKVYSEGLKIKLGTPLNQVVKAYIQHTLSRHDGDRDKTAKVLNLDKYLLSKKIKTYGLQTEV